MLQQIRAGAWRGMGGLQHDEGSIFKLFENVATGLGELQHDGGTILF